MFKKSYVLGAAISMGLLSTLSFANTDTVSAEDLALAEKGKQIFQENKKRDEGWVDFTADMLMI